MRAMFGLVGLLVTVGVLLMIFRFIEAPTLERGKQAQDEARQISGRGDDGVAAVDSFKVDPKYRGSDLQALTVTDVTPGGALAAYGLQKGDDIVQVNGMKVGDVSNNDPETAKALVHQAFQASQPIVVSRGGQRITLPASGATPAPPAAGSNTPQNQLNNINNAIRIPTH